MRSPHRLFPLAALILLASGAAPIPKHAAAHSATPRPAGSHPAPYRSVEVRVRTRDGQTLAGTLTLPAARGKRPAMLLLSSADATDRDASNMHGLYHPFGQIADTLSRHGIAVLRLDDRGVGRSTGRLDTLNTAERANDARDALAFLRARPEIDRRRVGLLGHSEGGLIAMMLAAEDTSLHAVVLMAATAHAGRQVVEWQERYAVAKGSVVPALRSRLVNEAMVDWEKRLAKDRWAAFFDRYDPLMTARKVRAAVLILQGNADTSCPPAEADALGSALRSAGNSEVAVQHLEGLDHAFLHLRDFENGVAHGDASFLLSSDVLARIVNWAVPRLH